MSKKMKTILVIVGVVVLVGFMAFGKIIAGYNRVIAMDENVKGKWAQVENQLKRRYDLIPNLVETVKGYAKHEKELFENIAQARTLYFQAKDVKDKVKASNQLEGVLSRLLLLQERYPDLKANQNFRDLQVALEGTENRINVARTRYNDAAKVLNSYAKQFFGSFFCKKAGVEPVEYFEATEQAKSEVPKVEF